MVQFLHTHHRLSCSLHLCNHKQWSELGHDPWYSTVNTLGGLIPGSAVVLLGCLLLQHPVPDMTAFSCHVFSENLRQFLGICDSFLHNVDTCRWLVIWYSVLQLGPSRCFLLTSSGHLFAQGCYGSEVVPFSACPRVRYLVAVWLAPGLPALITCLLWCLPGFCTVNCRFPIVTNRDLVGRCCETLFLAFLPTNLHIRPYSCL